MISLHKNQLAIWILLYTLNYITSFEYGTKWANLNNKQLWGVPPSAPSKAWQRLYYDNSNEIIGLKQLPCINGRRYGKINITNFGNYETINNKHGADPLRHGDRHQSIDNTKGNVLLSSRRKTFALIGYDEEIYKIMQKFTRSGQTGPIVVYFYLCQNHKYSNIGLLRTTPRILNLILSKYNYFNCINSNHIMIPRENNLFYADECLEDCNKLVTNINLKDNDNIKSYVDYFAKNCLNGKDNYQHNIEINNGNNFNTNDSPAINYLQLPQNNYKIKANPKKFLLHDLENINDRITYLENNLNENNKNNYYADVLNSDVVDKFVTDINKNYIDKYYSEKHSSIHDNALNVHSGLYSNSIPVQEFVSHPSHLESNEFKFKLHNNDNNFETIKNNVDIQTTNTSPAKNLNNAIILEGNFIKENLNTPKIDYDPSSNNKIDTYISYGKNKNLKQIYNTKDDERAVDNVPYNINYKEDQNGLVFPYKSTGPEIIDTALANNQVEYLPSREFLKGKSLFPDQYLNTPSIVEANYSIPRTSAYSSIKPDTNIQKNSSADPTNENIKQFNYVEPRLFAANAQTFCSETLNSNPCLQYTFNREGSDIMQDYNFVETNESKPFIDANTAIPYELKSPTNDVSQMNQHKLPYKRPDFTTLRYMNTPTALQHPGFYAQRELPNIKSVPSEGLNFNTFRQNLPVYQLDSPIVTPNSPKKQDHIFVKPRKIITNPSLNNPCNLVPIQLDKTYNTESNINAISMDGLPESKSKYLPTGDRKIHSLQTPLIAIYDESSPRHTNKENTSSVKFTQWKPVSLAKDFIGPNFPYNIANHKNKITPFVTPLQVVYQTIPKTDDVIPLDVELYTISKTPSFYDSHNPNKIISGLPKTDSSGNYKTSVENPKLPFQKSLSPKKLNVIPPTYKSLLHKKAPTWVQKYQLVDALPGQNVNHNLFTKNFKSDDNQGREPITDLSKATMGKPQYKVFNAPNAKTVEYYCPFYRYPSFFNIQNDNNGPTTTTTSSTSPNATPHGQYSLITEPQDKNNKEQSISNEITSPCHFPPLSQTSKTYTPQFSEEIKELTHQEAVSHTTEPQNKSNEKQSISNGIASPCYFPLLSQTSKTCEPLISEELRELTQQETIPRRNNQRNFKNLELPLASSTSYKNPSLYVPNNFNNMSPHPQLTTLLTATNHPSTEVQNSPAVNFAQPLKILDEQEYFKSPNIEYYNPTSKVMEKSYVTPLTPRVEFLPPKRTNMDFLNAAYFPSTAFGEAPKLSDIDDTNNNLACIEIPKVPPRLSLKRDEIKNIKNIPSTRIDQDTPFWIKKYYHHPLQAPHNLPIQINEQNILNKPAILKQESNDIQEKEPSVDLGIQINQQYPNENTEKYYSPLQRNPSFTDKPYSMIPKHNCNRYNMHQTSQNQYFPVIESHKGTLQLGQNRIADLYNFLVSQILQSYKPQSLEVPKGSKQIDDFSPQSKTKLTEFEPQHQPDLQNVNFSQANGSSFRNTPLNPYHLKSILRNVQQAEVPTATNQQSNLNFNQAENTKELHDNLYFQRNGQGLPNLTNKGPVSSTLYIHKHPPFEYTNPMWTILPQTLSNSSLDPKQQIKFAPMENSLEQNIKWYKNIPFHASGEGYKIPNPKLNYVKPFDYQANAYYPKISKPKGLQPCVSNTVEFYDPLITKPNTTSPQTIPALEPTRFSEPKKLWTQTLNHDLRTPEYFPTMLPAQIKYYTPLITKNVIPMKQPLVCINNNKINYYTKPINPSSSLTKNKPQPKIMFIQEPFSNFQQNSPYSSPISRNQERNINQVNNIVENHIPKKPVPFMYGESLTGGDKYHNIRNDSPCSLPSMPIPVNSYSPSSSITSQKSWIPNPYPKSTFNSKTKANPALKLNTIPTSLETPVIKITPSPKILLKLYKYIPFEDLKANGSNDRIPPLAAAPIINKTPCLKTQTNPYKYTPFEDLKDSGGSYGFPISSETPVIDITPFLKIRSNPYKYTTVKDLKDSSANHRIPTLAAAPIINITPSFKTRPNPYKIYTPFEDLKDSGGNHRIPTSGVAPVINITPSYKTRPTPYKYTPFQDLKDIGANITPPLGTRSKPYYKYTPSFKDLKYNGGNHRIPISGAAPIINVAPCHKTRPTPYKYTPFEDLKYYVGANITPPLRTRSNPHYKYTPSFKDLKYNGGNHRIPTSGAAPIINVAPSLKTRQNPYKYTPFEDLKDIGANITPPLGTQSNPYYNYKYTPSFKNLKYSGSDHIIPTSGAAPIINIAPSLQTRPNPYENIPTFNYLKDSDGNNRICTPAETPFIKLIPSINLSKYTAILKEPNGSAENNRISDLVKSATYPFEQYSPYPARFYAPTPNFKPRELLPTIVQPIQPKSESIILDYELQKPKLQEQPVAHCVPLYKIVKQQTITGNTENIIKHATPEDKTPCNILTAYKSKDSEIYDMKQPTNAAYISKNNKQDSLKLINDREKSSISSSQIPEVSWAPQNNLSPAQTVISKGKLQNGNLVPCLTENTPNLYETSALLPKVLGSSYYIPQDNVDALTPNQSCIAVPPTIQSAGKNLPLNQSPMQSVDNVFKNAVHKNDEPVQNILYSYPMEANQHNNKGFTDLRDNYVKPFKNTTCDCKVCERNPTILDQIMKHLYAYCKTLPDKFYESRAGFTNGKISIPFRDMGLAKYEVTKPNEFLKTEIPGLFIKAWGSRIKVIRPKLVLDVNEYDGYNFMPVIKNHYYSPEFAQNVAKDIVTRLYGEPIVIDGVYSPTSPYAVIDDINNALVNDGKAYILWPTLCNCGCMKSGCKCSFRS